ncbi:MAG TPA: hypothetical protein VE033_14005 [Acetobacteraceae bacterium]|nr:hypothetical protein [Acetobacteraceae bacterium]
MSRPAAALGRAVGRAATAFPRLTLVALCLLLFLPGLRSIPPLDLGEATVALLSRGLLAPGIPAAHEPPAAIHLLQAMSVRALEALGLAHRSGIAAFRLPSMVAAVLLVLLVHHAGTRLVGARAAFLSGALLACSAGVVAVAHLATAQAPLLAALGAALGLLARAGARPDCFHARHAAAFWVAVAALLLLGGPGAAACPVLGAALLAWLEGRARWLRVLRPGWGLPAMALPALSGLAPAWSAPGTSALLVALLPLAAFPGGLLAFAALPRLLAAGAPPVPRALLAWAAAGLGAELGGAVPLGGLAALPPLMLAGASWALEPGPKGPTRLRAWPVALLLAAPAIALAGAAASAALVDVRQLPVGVLVGAMAVLIVRGWAVHDLAGRPARAAGLAVLLAIPLYASILEGTLARLLIARAPQRVAGTAHTAVPGVPPEGIGLVGFGAAILFAAGPGARPLADGAEAARFLAEAPARVVALHEREERSFQLAAAALGLRPQAHAEVLSVDPLSRAFFVAIVYTAGVEDAGRGGVR